MVLENIYPFKHFISVFSRPFKSVDLDIVVFTKVGRLYSILFFEIREGAQCAHKMTRLSHFSN